MRSVTSGAFLMFSFFIRLFVGFVSLFSSISPSSVTGCCCVLASNGRR